ncbi:MAG TPA: hypothetical protein ENK05_01890 [Gammaproteobacteria bacterium]|nr:hypothetical protein [Gammaproteobacteria bacterium]
MASTPLPYKVIFVAGMSRAGSMWTYNVVRRLIRRSGYAPLPEEIPVEDLTEHVDELLKTAGDRDVLCLKTHRALQPITADMRIICPYRDVRDAMYSYMKFMRCPFERALKAASSMMDKTDYYLLPHRENVLPLRYNGIIDSPESTIRRIVRFLEMGVSAKDIEEIASNLSRRKVSNYLKSLDRIEVDEHGNTEAGGDTSRYSSAPRLDGSYRVYDKSTGFQSNHITTRKEGEWRHGLSQPQRETLMRTVSPWLIKHGFPL